MEQTLIGAEGWADWVRETIALEDSACNFGIFTTVCIFFVSQLFLFFSLFVCSLVLF